MAGWEAPTLPLCYAVPLLRPKINVLLTLDYKGFFLEQQKGYGHLGFLHVANTWQLLMTEVLQH